LQKSSENFVRREAATANRGQAKRESSQVKASAADVRDETPARSESQQTLARAGRGPGSILMWGTPMRIDSTWEELFAGRERRTQ
jgi:hypothetical protein